MQPLHLQLSSSPSYIIFFFSLLTAVAYKLAAADRISINCGSSAATSTSLSGREWVGDDDVTNPYFSIKGSSSSSSSVVKKGELTVAVDPVPYNTARVSRSQFTYTFHRLSSPGQKLIRLHFNPSSLIPYNNDFFTVEAGAFTLLANFSPSITARALSLPTVAKEFCLITTHENQPLHIIFTPSQQQQKHSSYAFVNGLEIISLPSTLSYCHGGDNINNGVQVVGQKSIVHIDHNTALETIHRLNVKWDSVPSDDGIRGMFGMWPTIHKQKLNGDNKYNITWKISVDVGFRYLVRLHFSEMGIKMAETGHKDFVLLVNHMIATNGADIIQEDDERQHTLWYKNYMVMVQGHKREGKRDFSISLCSRVEFFEGHIPLEGFEIFKLSNHDNSLSSPNPLPPSTTIRDSSTTNNIIVLVLGRRNAIATLVVTIICLLNIIVHFLRQSWESQLTEEDLKPSSRAKRLCRHFSLAEIESATINFNDAYVIGKGGFGKVYKGLIDNEQQIVAIKRLKSDSNQGKREFWTEIEILSELRHVNLVSLIGYCNKQPEMIVVYEYMPRGTLADHLYKLARKNNNNNIINNNNAFPFLSWKQRLNICIGAGRGLDYLHTGHGIIHRDVKTSNILLDENSIAKVSDFGLAKTESGSELQSLKGTFGYFDPNYYRTRILTTKSDVYSFGVVLLEVLCGRPAVEPLADEDKRSLSMWARDKINKQEVEQIVDPSLRGEISPDSLKVFVRVAERCLRDEPKKRPAMANVVISLQIALKKQENAESLAPSSEITSVNDFFPSNNGNANSSAPNAYNDDVVASSQLGKENSVLPDEITPNVSNILLRNDKTRSSVAFSSDVQNVTSTPKEQTYSGMINAGKRDGRKYVMHKLSRLLPWNAFSSIAKPSKKKEFKLFSISAPMASRNTRNMASRVNNTFVEKRIGEKIIGESYELMATPNLRIFSFAGLNAATRNFNRDLALGEGGFGMVYKGWIDEKPKGKSGTGYAIAVKRLSSESRQGWKEWQTELNFLGRLSHPNLVKLLGYCRKDEELLLVYEYLQKGSLENHIFPRGSSIGSLSWDIRLHILIGVARGLAFLHSLNSQVIYRDFKTSNILLDESYNAKLSDFGLAKLGPTLYSHVSTQVIGTYGYAAPEYVATGHLYVKSDVYSFGVVLLEMLTGLRALDQNRPYEQRNLVDWIKPYLLKTNKLKTVIDSRLEGQFPTTSASTIARLAKKCLESEPKNRPSMQEIVEALERINAPVEKSRQPKVQFSNQVAVNQRAYSQQRN